MMKDGEGWRAPGQYSFDRAGGIGYPPRDVLDLFSRGSELETTRALGIIPARYASSRFPGKPLASLSGKPMLQHVCERARSARRLEDVWVATDDRRIFDLVAGFGGRAVMTSPDHVCGTDRVAEAASRPEAAGIDVIVNVQGDQPLIAPEALDRLVAAFDGDAGAALRMATLYEPIKSGDDLRDPNVVKVVADRHGDALYFSRSPIPWSASGGTGGCLKHVGVYAFRKEYLFEFTRMPRGRLEAAESLEQLRVLEAGHRIRLVASSGSSISVETPGDIGRVEAIIGD